MHILFCTAAKHLFGIKMCTPVSTFLSLNITILIYTVYLTFSSEISDLIR